MDLAGLLEQLSLCQIVFAFTMTWSASTFLLCLQKEIDNTLVDLDIMLFVQKFKFISNTLFAERISIC